MTRIILSTICVLSVACSSIGAARAPAPLHATTCEGGVVRSDAELERYQGCRRVAGDLELRGVTSLTPLESLRRVDGTLSIGHTQSLYTLAGLERLRSVGTFELSDNAALIYAGALRNLGQVHYASVRNNPRLSASNGFLDGITRASGAVEFSGNWGLAAEGVTQSREDRAIAAR